MLLSHLVHFGGPPTTSSLMPSTPESKLAFGMSLGLLWGWGRGVDPQQRKNSSPQTSGISPWNSPLAVTRTLEESSTLAADLRPAGLPAALSEGSSHSAGAVLPCPLPSGRVSTLLSRIACLPSPRAWCFSTLKEKQAVNYRGILWHCRQCRLEAKEEIKLQFL